MRLLLLLISFGILVTACGANAEPLIVTVAPSETINFDALPTESNIPSPTFAVLPTITLAPTQVVEESGSEQQVGSNPLRPTFTVAPATQTATFQPQLVGLQVEYFITNAEDAPAPGDPITLFWRVNQANSARIFRLNQDDRRLEVWNVEPEGRLTVGTDPETEQGEARFLLQGEANGSVVEQTLVIEMSSCTISWFFLPAPEDCPAGLPQPSQQVEQRFEGGLMIWLAVTEEIYIFYTDGQSPSWQRYPDTFGEGIPETDDSIIPPAERFQPIRGFGLVWRENSEVRDRLGWAVEPELGYDGIIQTSLAATDDQTIYLRVRDSGILAAAPQSWEILAATETLETVPPGDPSLITPTVPDNSGDDGA